MSEIKDYVPGIDDGIKNSEVDQAEFEDMLLELDDDFSGSIGRFSEELKKDIALKNSLIGVFAERMNLLADPLENEDIKLVLAYHKIIHGGIIESQEKDLADLKLKIQVLKNIDPIQYLNYLSFPREFLFNLSMNMTQPVPSSIELVNISGDELNKCVEIIDTEFRNLDEFSIEELYIAAIYMKKDGLESILSVLKTHDKKITKEEESYWGYTHTSLTYRIENMARLFVGIPEIEGKTKKETLSEQLDIFYKYENILAKQNGNSTQIGVTDISYWPKHLYKMCIYTPTELEKYLSNIISEIPEMNFVYNLFYENLSLKKTKELLSFTKKWGLRVPHQSEDMIRFAQNEVRQYNKLMKLITSKKYSSDIVKQTFTFGDIGVPDLSYAGLKETKQILKRAKMLGIFDKRGLCKRHVNKNASTFSSFMADTKYNLGIFEKTGISDSQITKELGVLDGLYETNGDPLLGQFYKELFEETPGSHNLAKFLDKYPQTIELPQRSKLYKMGIENLPLDIKKGTKSVHRFRGVLEMLKSRDDIDIPIDPKEGDEIELQRRKEAWEKIINEYESFIQYKISLDYTEGENGKKIEKPIDETFGQIFYCSAVESLGEDHNGAFSSGEIIKNELSKFTKDGNMNDFSSKGVNGIRDKEHPRDSSKLIQAVKDYAEINPDKSIYIYIGHHGGTDGQAGPFSKTDLLALSNISVLSTVQNFFKPVEK